MSRYITVLNSTVNNKYWKAIQVGDSLDAIRKKRYYTAGVSTSLPKNSDDTYVEDKTVIEVSTQLPANAKIYKLAAENFRAIRLMNS